MANFHFNLKKTTYEESIKEAQALLTNDDIDNGLLYVNKALSVCTELINNCIIEQVKMAYMRQYKQLKQLKENLEKGINPFSRTKKQVTIDTNESSSTPKSSESSNVSAKNENNANYKFFTNEAPNVTLDDIAGLEDVKEQIRLRVLAPLNNPEVYYKYADEVGCQILMYGPPGCGKTFIATAIAGELKCPYAIIDTADILDKYVGEAPKKIKEIFEEASKFDNCLIFFDELESLFASRESEDSRNTKEIITTMLTCLSGFKSSNEDKKIRIIIGATNRPWIIDSALLRGKRMDTQIYVGLPDKEARRFLINKEFKKHMFLIENTDVSIDDLVNLLDGYSGADISSILNQVKLMPLKRALANSNNGNDKIEVVTRQDVDSVMSKYRNSVTKESLEAYEAFKNGEI